MTKQQDHLERLNEIVSSISLQAFEDCDVQGTKVAANMLVQYGGKSALTPEGFISAIIQTHTMCFAWLVADGYVSLRAKAKVSDEERAKREEKRKSRVRLDGIVEDHFGEEDERHKAVGAYL